MKKGDYVLYDGGVWEVWLKHSGGSYQIKTLEPLTTWIDNIEVRPEQVTPITKEVADVIIKSNEKE